MSLFLNSDNFLFKEFRFFSKKFQPGKNIHYDIRNKKLCNCRISSAIKQLQQSATNLLEFPIIWFGFVEVLWVRCPTSADPKVEIIYCTVKRIKGSYKIVVLFIFIWVVFYVNKMFYRINQWARWAFLWRGTTSANLWMMVVFSPWAGFLPNQGNIRDFLFNLKYQGKIREKRKEMGNQGKIWEIFTDSNFK